MQHRFSWQTLVHLGRHRQELVVYIVTDQVRAISERILGEMKRGVTSWLGTGMYSGQTHSILMCVLAVTEVAQLKALVRQEDAKAFVIVSPAQEVLGQGFDPLQTGSAR